MKEFTFEMLHTALSLKVQADNAPAALRKARMLLRENAEEGGTLAVPLYIGGEKAHLTVPRSALHIGTITDIDLVVEQPF